MYRPGSVLVLSEVQPQVSIELSGPSGIGGSQYHKIQRNRFHDSAAPPFRSRHDILHALIRPRFFASIGSELSNGV